MNRITIAVKEPGKNWEPREVEDDLKTFQTIVGGYIEHFYTTDDGVLLFCNENGKFLDLKFNIRFFTDQIFGTIFAVRSDDEGDFCSLTSEDVLNLNERGIE